MKTATTAMQTLLNDLGGAQSCFIAELITITLADGTILNYTTGEGNLTLSGTTYLGTASGPMPIVKGLNWKLGVEVDELKLEIWATETNVVESQMILSAIVQGLFDNAEVTIQRVYMPTYGNVSAGSLLLFTGFVSDIPIADAAHAELDVKSRKELLNIPLPYLTYQPGCIWPLYGVGCTLNAASFGVNGTLSTGSGQLLMNTNLTQVDQYFSEGKITFTSGANTGVSRTIRSYLNASGQILLFIPLPNAVSIGDAFTAYPGCDKQQSTCLNKFNNLIHFGGNPYVPIPESAV